MFNKLKKRWNIESNFQVLVILVVFAVTGSSTVYIKQLIFDVIGITPETSVLIKVPLYIIVILPTYNILLLLVGFLFGQFNFFRNFVKKFLLRFSIKKRKKVIVKLNADS